MKLLTILTTLMLLGGLNASKILAIFPAPCQSHSILRESLLRGLVKRGHQVTMMSPYPFIQPLDDYEHVIIEGIEHVKKAYWSKFMNVHTKTLEKVILAKNMFPLLHDIVHNSTNVRKFVQKGEKYDLCIVSYLMMESMISICHAVQAPAIGFSVVGMSSMVPYHTQNPVPYSYVPTPFLSLTDDMSLIDRTLNALTWTLFDVLFKFVLMPYHEKIVQKYYPGTPSVQSLIDNVDLYLLNSHIATDTPKPFLPNVIPIGGFHLQIMEPIPEDLRVFLDNSKNGVIYFNLGTNAKSSDLEENVVKTLLSTFAKLEYNVLWKFEGDLPNLPKNVRIAKWLPQRPILMHPNVKIFMTHGGLGGIVESIYAGVPMICMPIFADQSKNCADSVSNGYALLVKLSSVTQESLMKSIKEIGNNPSYKEKVLLKSDIYRNQEINPMDRAIFWIEHVIRHKGAKHLKGRAAMIPWYQYYLLDVIVALCIVSLGVVFIVKHVMKLLWKLLGYLVGKVRRKNVKVKRQ